MKSRTLVPIVATIAILVGGGIAGFAVALDGTGWMVLAQSAGTIGALVWVAYTGLLQERQLRENALATNRQIALQALDMLKPDLEDLMRSIEIEAGKMGQNAERYEGEFRAGVRTAYVALLTAGHGERLRRITLAHKPEQLRRRLKTYVMMFEPIDRLSARDTEFHSVVESSPHGRVYIAARAALAETEAAAAPFMAKLRSHDTGAE